MSGEQDEESETEIGIDALEVEYETRAQPIVEKSSSSTQPQNPSGFVGPFGKKQRMVRGFIEKVQLTFSLHPPPSTSNDQITGSSPSKSPRLEFDPPVPSNYSLTNLDLWMPQEESRKAIWEKTGVPILFSDDRHPRQQRPSIISFHSSSSSTPQVIPGESGESVSLQEEHPSTAKNQPSTSTHRPLGTLTPSSFPIGIPVQRVGPTSRGSRRSSSTTKSTTKPKGGGKGVSSSGSEKGSEGKPPKVRKRYVCTDCNKEFSQLRNFRYHRSRHEGTNQFGCTCPVCGKSFNDKGYLGSHLKIHANAKEYKCEYCGKCFNQRVAYNMHIRIHTGIRPHKCHLCPKAFSRKMLLKHHILTHTGERPYKCGVCQRAFADQSNMKLHQKLHSGERPHKCQQCDRCFSKKHHLNTHMVSHSGARPYKCDKCQSCFSQTSNMRTHHKKCKGIPRNGQSKTRTSTVTSTRVATSTTTKTTEPHEQPRFVKLPYTFGQTNFECPSLSVEVILPALTLPFVQPTTTIVYPVHHQNVQMFPPTQNPTPNPQQQQQEQNDTSVNPRRSRVRTVSGGVIQSIPMTSTLSQVMPDNPIPSTSTPTNNPPVNNPTPKRKGAPRSSSATDTGRSTSGHNYPGSGMKNPSSGTGARKSLKFTPEKTSTSNSATSSKVTQMTSQTKSIPETKKRSTSTRISCAESAGQSSMSTLDLSFVRPRPPPFDTTAESPIPLSQYRPSAASSSVGSSRSQQQQQQQSSSPAVFVYEPPMIQIPYAHTPHYISPPMPPLQSLYQEQSPPPPQFQVPSASPPSGHQIPASSNLRRILPAPPRHVSPPRQQMVSSVQPGERPHFVYETQLPSIPVQQQQQQLFYPPPYSQFPHYYPHFPLPQQQQQQRVDPVAHQQIVQPSQGQHSSPEGQEGRNVSPQEIILNQLQQHNLLPSSLAVQTQMQVFTPQLTMNSPLLYQQQFLEQYQQLHGQRTAAAAPLQRPQFIYFDHPQVQRSHRHPPPQGREETIRIPQQQPPPAHYQQFVQTQGHHPGQMREVSQHGSYPYWFDQRLVENQQQYQLRKEQILAAQQQLLLQQEQRRQHPDDQPGKDEQGSSH